MKPFSYWKDPYCTVACALYVANRWVIKPHCDWPFLHSYFNDVLLIPAALPWILWLHRNLGLRTHDGIPTFAEIAFHVTVWSLVCEWLGPRLIFHSVGDPFDAVAYGVGGLLAWLAWNHAFKSVLHEL